MKQMAQGQQQFVAYHIHDPTNNRQNVVNQISHLVGPNGGTLYQITRKQKEQIE